MSLVRPQVEQQRAVTDKPDENWGDMYACEFPAYCC